MLPVVQTLATLTKFYGSLNQEQKDFLSKIVTSFGGDWLAHMTNADPRLIELVRAEGSIDQKMMQIAANPSLITGSQPDRSQVTELYLQCPHCDSPFYKEI